MSQVHELAAAKFRHHHKVYARLSVLMGLGRQASGEGSTLRDGSGRSYLSLFDQYGNQAFGYAHPQLVEALASKLQSGNINSAKIFLEDEHIALARELSIATGGVLPYAYFANGGGETVDNALKLARGFNRRPNFVTAIGCMHGKTLATLAASGRPEHHDLFSPLMPEFRQVPFNDVSAMDSALDDTVSAVVLEPVQAEAGVFPPAPGYLEAVRRLCNERGVLLIFDEMQTAFGRVGSMFAFQTYGVVPDMLCVGKAFGGGLLPISAVLGTEKVWAAIDAMPSAFGSSLGGNPLCCAVARAVLRIASEEKFQASVQELGALAKEHLELMAARHPGIVRAVRGAGLMFGVDFFREEIAGAVLARLFDVGLTSTFSLFNSCVLRVQPPMVITPVELRRALATFSSTLDEVAETLRSDVDFISEPKAEVSFLVEQSVSDLVERLHANPYLVDPFSNEVVDGLPSLWLGGAHLAWSEEEPARFADGVLLSARPDWLWNGLNRRVKVHPDGHQARITISAEWSFELGGYEGIAHGKLKAFCASQRTRVMAAVCGEEASV